MTNKTDNFEKRLRDFSKHAFNAEENSLDTDVLQRLKQAREMAVSTVPQTQPIITPQSKQNNKITIDFPTWFTPVSTAAAFASITVISTSLLFQFAAQNNPMEKIFQSPFDDIAILSSNEELELYEDIDFYIWLENDELNSDNNKRHLKNIKRDKSAG